MKDTSDTLSRFCAKKAQQHWPQLHIVMETPLQNLIMLKIIYSGISVSLLQLKLPATDLHSG